MKNLLSFCFAITLVTLFISCSEDNFDITTEEELDFEPVIVNVENSLNYQLATTPPVATVGTGYKISSDFDPSGANFCIASEGVTMDCSDGSYATTTVLGAGDSFNFAFYYDNSGAYVYWGFFDAIIDGEVVAVSSAIIPPDCPREIVTVDFTETSDRVEGTFRGEFFRYADDLVSPFDSCVNYVSLGILEANFNVEIFECN